MPDTEPDCPCEEELSHAQLINCMTCQKWWHTACAGLTGITPGAISKLTQWKCHLCFELPEKLKKDNTEDTNIVSIQQKMEISLKAFIHKTIEDQMLKKINDLVNAKVEESIAKLVNSQKEIEMRIDEKVKKTQIQNVNKVVEEQVNQKIKEMPAVNVNVDEKIKQVIRMSSDEERLIKKKEKNLMFFNIPEEDYEDTMDRMLDDFKKIKAIYEDKHITLDESDLIQINRVGPKKVNHIRPIVTTFASQDKRMDILTHNQDLKLKVEQEIINVYVATDRTPKQREADKKLRVELNQRKENGEENITIRNDKIVPFRERAQETWASKFRM